MFRGENPINGVVYGPALIKCFSICLVCFFSSTTNDYTRTDLQSYIRLLIEMKLADLGAMMETALEHLIGVTASRELARIIHK